MQLTVIVFSSASTGRVCTHDQSYGIHSYSYTLKRHDHAQAVFTQHVKCFDPQQ